MALFFNYNECVRALCELLINECCNLIDLSLHNNRGINDEGLRILCEDVLSNEHCKLERMDLMNCSLTDDCLPEPCNALQHEHCRLDELCPVGNEFTEKGKTYIHEIKTPEHRYESLNLWLYSVLNTVNSEV